MKKILFENWGNPEQITRILKTHIPYLRMMWAGYRNGTFVVRFHDTVSYQEYRHPGGLCLALGIR